MLRTPAGEKLTRPTSGKVRQALFNILRGRVEDASFIDLFAGSGAVGLEALSRGARRTVLVERHPAAFKVLEANCRLLLSRGADPTSLEWTRQDARAYALLGKDVTADQKFDIVFADPPFGQDFSGLPDLLLPLLTPDGIRVIQYPTRNPPEWVATMGDAGRLHVYGESTLAVFGQG